MIDMPEREREPWNCMRCGLPIPSPRYVYCSEECQDADVPIEPGRGGVRS